MSPCNTEVSEETELFVPEDTEITVRFIKTHLREAELGLQRFQEASKTLAAEGYSIVAQKDGTLFIFKDITEHFDGYTKTTRISFGKLYEEPK